MSRPGRATDAQRRAFVGLLALALASCALPARDEWEARVEPGARVVGSQAGCTPRFEDQDGWLGGDVAASIPLVDADAGVVPRADPPVEQARAPRRSVWLFGDSFVSPAGAPRERSYPFVHNAIAVSTCRADGAWSMDFVWRGGAGAGAEPRAFFEPDASADWVARVRAETGGSAYYWPLSGALVRGTLFVALLRVAPAPAHGPFALPFRPVGVDLARIETTGTAPETWRIRYSALSSRSGLLPAASLVAGTGYLFAFATLDRGDGGAPRGLTRLPLAALVEWRPDLEPFLETLAEDGRWRARVDPDEARVLMADDASEMSVHFDPGLREWLAVYSDPTADPEPTRGPPPRADAIWLRRAGRLEGPWSPPQVLGRIPGLAAATDPLPGEPFCYAAKAHPELAPSGELFVTWVCSLFPERPEETPRVLERLRTTPEIYRPRAARFELPLHDPVPSAPASP